MNGASVAAETGPVKLRQSVVAMTAAPSARRPAGVLGTGRKRPASLTLRMKERIEVDPPKEC
ncbi:hypothetical protein GCM10009828_028020 [Actinoplanes couchii]|uniref:Uncharacterized protein n=1 Tax=Actinoplanes couchii TaxID=403638 RepID=A0ABQ3XCJ5_9ACTN|nr:hypothetical protein Aco03nite_046330 [Actinoplanes couchii]